MHRVAVTGIGVISALGPNQHLFWDALQQGVCAIGPMDIDPDRPAPPRFKNAAQIKNFDPDKYFSPRQIGFMDRFAQFAVIAAREAVEQAGVQWTDELRDSTAIITGSCIGGRGTEETGYWDLYHNSRNRVHPLTIPLGMANAGASHISIEFGIHGPTYTISTACSSSAHALGNAFWMVRSGVAPMAIAGGSEAPMFFGGLKAWEAMRVVSQDTCRPFSADRSGMILGEGAAMLVLEPLEAALARGATPLGEILGFGMSSDAVHIIQPSQAGAERALRAALRDACLRPDQIGYINAHGTATDVNDSMEVAAIRGVFGDHADKVMVSSTKSMHGHTLGAAGAIEAATAVLALRDGVLPPTANYTSPDPACDLDVIPNTAREAHVDFALSNSFAFGGLNAVLAFRAFRGE
jgi:nodulation protein E